MRVFVAVELGTVSDAGGRVARDAAIEEFETELDALEFDVGDVAVGVTVVGVGTTITGLADDIVGRTRR